MFENELQKNKLEQESIKNSLFASQIAFANTIKHGLGDDIKNHLKNPVKPSKYKAFLFKLKSFFIKLINIC